jgi:hypothetical protein
MPDLARIVADVVPICRGSRPPERFHFDSGVLTGSTRYDVPHFLRWAGMPGGVLPFEHVFIHGDLDVPARLESWAAASGELRFYLTLSAGLFSSAPAVRTAIAHGVTHLYLILAGEQRLFGRGTSERPDDPEEVRTDVAAVALGFGKLMLHGVEDYAARQPGKPLGYLTIDQLTQVYDRVNELVRVPRGHATR